MQFKHLLTKVPPVTISGIHSVSVTLPWPVGIFTLLTGHVVVSGEVEI